MGWCVAASWAAVRGARSEQTALVRPGEGGRSFPARDLIPSHPCLRESSLEDPGAYLPAPGSVSEGPADLGGGAPVSSILRISENTRGSAAQTALRDASGLKVGPIRKLYLWFSLELHLHGWGRGRGGRAKGAVPADVLATSSC